MKTTIKKLRQLIRETVMRLNEDTCLCGIERADCEYHNGSEPRKRSNADKSIEILRRYARFMRKTSTMKPHVSTDLDRGEWGDAVAVLFNDQMEQEGIATINHEGNIEVVVDWKNFDSEPELRTYSPEEFETAAFNGGNSFHELHADPAEAY